MKKIIPVLALAFCTHAAAQTVNFWSVLAEVNFKGTKDKNGYTVERPVFSRYLQSFDGKTIRLKGYIIPLGETGSAGKFMLSSMPFNLCYFCGAAGPETVVEVETGSKMTFTTRQVTVEGTLGLNADNPDHHIYILRSSHLVP